MTPDQQLLHEYVEHGSQPAFAQLVERYKSLVYSTCLRELNDSALAEDVTQVVLLLLAMRAPTLQGHTAVAGWLFQTARFASKNAGRQEMRRRRAELKAAEDERTDRVQSADDWCEGVEPILNRALLSLRPGEREVILLRFFEDRSIQETGAALGISQGAAQQRISRAVDKLRRYFLRKGIALSTAALVGLLSTRITHAIPLSCQAAVLNIGFSTVAGRRPSYSGSISGSTSQSISESIDTMTRGVLRAMWTAKLQTALLLASVLLLPFGLVTKRIINNVKPSDSDSQIHLSAANHSLPESSLVSNHSFATVNTSFIEPPEVRSIGAQLAAVASQKSEPQAPVSVADHSLADDPQIRRKVTIKTEGIALGELFALMAKQTGVRLQVDDYTADDKVIILGPPRPLNEIMADIAALYNDTWLHSRDGDRHTYRLTRLPIARDDEDKLSNEMNRKLLAHLEEQIKALDETPEQLAKRPETDPIRQALAVPENRVTTSILGLLSQEQREQLIDQWKVYLPVSELSAAQKDGIEDLFFGQRFEELRKRPLVVSGVLPPPQEILRDQMDQQQITFEVQNISGANRRDADMHLYLRAPIGFVKPVTTFRTRARFLFAAHGDPYSRQKMPTTASLTDSTAADACKAGAWPDRLRSFAERSGSPVVADYYRSKSVFAPGDDDEASPEPTIAALDNFCRPEGYMWWNRGKTLLFRKRDWYNQRLYEVPDRWVLAMSKNLHAQAGVPTVADVLALLDLSTNQIAGLAESLGIGSDRRLLIGLRALLTAVAAMPVEKGSFINTGNITDFDKAAILPDVRDGRQRALLQAFAQVYNPKLFADPNLAKFGVVFMSQSKDTVASTIGVGLYTMLKNQQQNLGGGYLIGLPLSLPDDRRDKTTIRLEP